MAWVSCSWAPRQRRRLRCWRTRTTRSTRRSSAACPWASPSSCMAGMWPPLRRVICRLAMRRSSAGRSRLQRASLGLLQAPRVPCNNPRRAVQMIKSGVSRVYLRSSIKAAAMWPLFARPCIVSRSRPILLMVRLNDVGEACREEGAETLIEQMSRDQDPIIRYGAMFVIGLAYRGTANNGQSNSYVRFSKFAEHVACQQISPNVGMYAARLETCSMFCCAVLAFVSTVRCDCTAHAAPCSEAWHFLCQAPFRSCCISRSATWQMTCGARRSSTWASSCSTSRSRRPASCRCWCALPHLSIIANIRTGGLSPRFCPG